MHGTYTKMLSFFFSVACWFSSKFWSPWTQIPCHVSLVVPTLISVPYTQQLLSYFQELVYVMDADHCLLYSTKSFSTLTFIASVIPLIIQHDFLPGQIMHMNTATLVFIISSFEVVLKSLIISLFWIAIIPCYGISLFIISWSF